MARYRVPQGPGPAFREEPSDNLVRAPWLLIALGLALFFVGLVFALSALKVLGVIVALVGGALFQAVLSRADACSSEQSDKK